MFSNFLLIGAKLVSVGNVLLKWLFHPACIYNRMGSLCNILLRRSFSLDRNAKNTENSHTVKRQTDFHTGQWRLTTNPLHLCQLWWLLVPHPSKTNTVRSHCLFIWVQKHIPASKQSRDLGKADSCCLKCGAIHIHSEICCGFFLMYNVTRCMQCGSHLSGYSKHGTWDSVLIWCHTVHISYNYFSCYEFVHVCIYIYHFKDYWWCL